MGVVLMDKCPPEASYTLHTTAYYRHQHHPLAVDQEFGGGSLSSYSINSNTSASVFTKMVMRDGDATAHSCLKNLWKEHQCARDLEAFGNDCAPLHLVGKVLCAGEPL